ncbi:hypothetical protein PAPYR_4269 [Paratrimastix pyriformis]|uniref:Right handed beta helix domain-containing protein n=1 Tax=Paratrimastix pyriformis TaxID=342808 RepID=A0ABQ8UK05_9EUKA|nr:hypothetical protein PAPYR_4269 [Paratrimastix pyriformis]
MALRLVAFFTCALVAANAQIVYVNSVNGTDVTECGASDRPCLSISFALDRSVDHPTLILDGSFSGQGNFNISFRGTENVRIHTLENVTATIVCDSSEYGAFIANNGEKRIYLSGLNFQNCSRALLLDGITDVQVVGCSFRGGRSGQGGGAISATNVSGLLLDGCIFDENTAPAGSAIALDGCQGVTIRSSNFTSNNVAPGQADATRAAVVSLAGSPTRDLVARDCRFSGNRGQTQVLIEDGSWNVTLDSLTFSHNLAPLSPDAIATGLTIRNASRVTVLTLNTLTNRALANGTGSIYISQASRIAIAGAILDADDGALGVVVGDSQDVRFNHLAVTSHWGRAMLVYQSAGVQLTNSAFADCYGSPHGAALAVASFSTVNLSRVTFARGEQAISVGAMCTLGMEDVNIFEFTAPRGAGLSLSFSTANLTNCRFSSLWAHAGLGGAVYAESSQVLPCRPPMPPDWQRPFWLGAAAELVVAMQQSTFISCAADEGGAVYLRSSDLTDQGSTFSGNRALVGGAIRMFGRHTTAALVGTKALSNTAKQGGAIAMDPTASAISLSGATLDQNTASVSGGALYMFEEAHLADEAHREVEAAGPLAPLPTNEAGGAASLSAAGAPDPPQYPTVTILATTFMANTAETGLGGALCLRGPYTATIRQSLFINNQAPRGAGVRLPHMPPTIRLPRMPPTIRLLPRMPPLQKRAWYRVGQDEPEKFISHNITAI